MTLEQLKGLEQLNELAFSEEEKQAMVSIFSEMEESEKLLNTIDTENTDIMVHVMPMENVLREDVRKQDFDREDLLNCGAERSEDSWVVPKLVK
ncbi:MAG: Asp-tRNA(Asn)/Glu-tRNA(Gln) amidotransferase subunit GatC [Ruminococcaceae bacterium]|nr:Asp-tRNA(Asn)/Glu-tRNA(Gln) amidotransferase subunit GatC [Oscillospiraceae bacterium]